MQASQLVGRLRRVGRPGRGPPAGPAGAMAPGSHHPSHWPPGRGSWALAALCTALYSPTTVTPEPRGKVN